CNWHTTYYKKRDNRSYIGTNGSKCYKHSTKTQFEYFTLLSHNPPPPTYVNHIYFWLTYEIDYTRLSFFVNIYLKKDRFDCKIRRLHKLSHMNNLLTTKTYVVI